MSWSSGTSGVRRRLKSTSTEADKAPARVARRADFLVKRRVFAEKAPALGRQRAAGVGAFVEGPLKRVQVGQIAEPRGHADDAEGAARDAVGAGAEGGRGAARPHRRRRDGAHDRLSAVFPELFEHGMGVGAAKAKGGESGRGAGRRRGARATGGCRR